MRMAQVSVPGGEDDDHLLGQGHLALRLREHVVDGLGDALKGHELDDRVRDLERVISPSGRRSHGRRNKTSC